MKRKKIDHNIPLDLVVEILIRLPTKSVIKFKSVSKIWLSIIVSRVFIESFASISSTRPRFLVTFTNGIYGKREEKRLFFFSSSQEEGPESAIHYMTLPNPGVSTNNGSCASVHGFMGCQISPGFIICNPSTRQVILLPILPISHCVRPYIRSTCLCYDPVSDQFKAFSLFSPLQREHESHVQHLVLTLKGDKRNYSWRLIQGNFSIPPYYPVTTKICIRGKVYYGAWTPKFGMEPVIVCFDVGSEKLTFIKAHRDFLCWQYEPILLEYKGKLASIIKNRWPFEVFDSFDFWVLEDVEKHEWSKHICAFPLSCWDNVWEGALKMSFPGTNKAGELIIAPRYLQRQLGPFYIFYCNVETNNIRRVRLHGIADDEEFRHSYGFGKTIPGFDDVYITPEHVENLRVL
ncbi:unnamed protein product [Eruca vesicaria subsp. sativa]|uniref:F-box domain-containing protein n=1 Tax=Eruca vesicaria subsp. sativa TaxID=29727 RepID=A0ABC8JUB3_ERUVS|nr:unnamed protein product [Eruca vesicaria subsp. sativa]